MSDGSVVILLMIGAFIHDSCAIGICYFCKEPTGGKCDGPLDPSAKKKLCKAKHTGCATAVLTCKLI